MIKFSMNLRAAVLESRKSNAEIERNLLSITENQRKIDKWLERNGYGKY